MLNQNSGITIELVNQATGEVIPTVNHNGTTYAAALVGKEFSIRVTTPRDGRRREAVLSVDGLDVLTGKPASTDARGLVFRDGVWETKGFRLDDKNVAQFFFTEGGSSYAAQSGKPQNVGVIACAIFEERERPVFRGAVSKGLSYDGSLESTRGGGTFGATRGGNTKGLGHDVGTGFGRQQREEVGTTTFDRASTTPVAVVGLEYASPDRLRKAGIPIDPPLGAVNPFPANAPSNTGCKPPAGWNPNTGSTGGGKRRTTSKSGS